MKKHIDARIVVVVAVMLCVAFVTAVAFAELPSAGVSDNLGGIENRWVQQAMTGSGAATDTAHAVVLRIAKDSLADPPTSVFGQAAMGSEVARQQLLTASELKSAEPTIVAHEFVVWNDARAAHVLVYNGGLVRVLGVGAVNDVLLTPSTTPTMASDVLAADALKSTGSLMTALDPAASTIAGALLTGHAVGFANQTGSHLVVRVGADGTPTFTDW